MEKLKKKGFITVFKALIKSGKKIQVVNKESGEPYLRFSGKALETYTNLECNIIVSISHSQNYGAATAILESWE